MAFQSVVYIKDANGNTQAIACIPYTWNGVSANIQACMVAPWNYTTISASGVTVIKNAPGTIGGIINLSPNLPQTAEIQVFDNASTNAGNKVADTSTLSSVLNWGDGGMALTLGITVNVIGTLLGSGLVVLWY